MIIELCVYFSFTSIGPLCKNKTLSSARATTEAAILHRSRTERYQETPESNMNNNKKNNKTPLCQSLLRMQNVFFSPMPHHQQQQQKDQVYKRKNGYRGTCPGTLLQFQKAQAQA
jgi:hypothetical protein